MHNFCPTWRMQLKLPSTNYSLFLDHLRPKYGRCKWEIAMGAVQNPLKGKVLATWNLAVLKNSIFTPFLFIHHLKLLFIKIEPVKRLRMHSTFAKRDSIHTLIAQNSYYAQNVHLKQWVTGAFSINYYLLHASVEKIKFYCKAFSCNISKKKKPKKNLQILTLKHYARKWLRDHWAT